MSAYRGLDGTMCAVGCLISDSNYSPDLEGKNVYDRAVMEATGIPKEEGGYGEVLNLLRDLQEVHDEELVEDWPEHLNSVAQIYGLKADIVKQLQPAFTEKRAQIVREVGQNAGF